MRKTPITKSTNFIYENDKEKKYMNVFNDYGYNFDYKNDIDYEKKAYKPEKSVNKDYFNIKK